MNETACIIDKISYLTSLVTVNVIRLNSFSPGNEQTKLTQDEKTQLLNLDTRNVIHIFFNLFKIKTTYHAKYLQQINELITSFGSNQKASPIILAWATFLYNLSTDETLTKVFTSEMKTLTNRMFALSVKENVFSYLLNLFATNQFSNQVT
jgi:hypothetical protein